MAAVGAERQQDIGWSGGSGGAPGEPDTPEPQREQVQRHQHPGASGGFEGSDGRGRLEELMPFVALIEKASSAEEPGPVQLRGDEPGRLQGVHL